MHFRDWLLLIASITSILVGIAWPEYGAPLRPYPVYCMMALLFFSFLPVQFRVVLSSIKDSLLNIGCYVFAKMVLLPLLAFTFFRYFFPKYATAALLLSGISTGVASPFFAGLFQANIPLVFGVVVVSSILVPFTLPALVYILLGKYIEISLLGMARLLGMIIFCPLLLSEILKRFAPNFSVKLSRAQYSVSLVSFVITNIGIFSRYADFLRREPATVLTSLGISVVLAIAFFMAGLLFSFGRSLPDHLALIITFGFINNVLALILSSEFFSPIEATMAAMYTIPFFGLIIPLRAYRTWAARKGAS